MKILLIEDDPADQEFVRDLVGRFTGAKYDLVIEAKLGTGLPRFTDPEVALILLDLNLPDSRGLGTFTTTRQLAGHVPIVILTGIEDDGLGLKAVEAGAQDYLVKGRIDAPLLEKAVRYAIERHRILRELKAATSRLLRKEEALGEREKTLEALLNAPLDTMALLDPGGHILEINATGARRFGKSREELVGLNVFDLLPPEVARSRKERIDRVFRTGIPEHFEDFRDGRYFLNHVFPVPGGDGLTGVTTDRVAIFAADITEKKEGEGRIQASESIYRTIFESTGAATAILDEKGVIVRANHEAEALFGYSPGELEGKLTWDRLVSPDDLARLTEYWRLLHEDPSSSNQRYEARLVDRWGRIRYGILSVRLIPGTGNCVVSIVDITEKRRGDEAIEESEERFRGLFDHMASGVAVYQAIDEGKDFIFQDFNTAAESIEDVHRQDILGRRVTDVFPGVKDLGLLGVFQRVWKTGETEYLPPSRYSDGRHPVSWRENWVYRLPTGEIVSMYNDVTGRMRTDESLRETRDYLDHILQSLNDAFLALDREWRFTFVNRQALKMMGLQSSEELLGRSIWDAFPVIIGTPLEEGYRRAMRERVPVHLENKSDIAKGRWYELDIYPIHDGINILGREITGRKEAEEALRESEMKFRTVIENIPDLIIVHRDGIIRYVNNSAIYTMEIRAEDLLNRPVFDFIAPEYHDVTRRAMQRRVMGEWVEPYEIEILAKSGRRTVVISGSRIEFEGKPASLNVLTDVTERRRAEKEILDLKRQMEFILGATKTGLDVIDADYNMVYIDPEWAQAYGSPVGKKCYEYFSGMSGVCPDCGVEKAIATGKPVVAERTLAKENNRPVQVTTIPFRNEKGESLFAQVYVDITERKKAEERLRLTQFSMDTCGDAVMWLRPDGSFSYVNDAACRLFGYSREELLTMAGPDLNTEHPRGAWQSYWEDLRKKGVLTFENTLLGRGGRRVPVEITANYLEFEGKEFNCSFIRDLTERKQAEAAIRESEEKYRTMFENTGTATVVLEEDTLISLANSEFARLSGYTREEIEGKKSWTGFVVKEDLRRMQAQHRLRRKNREKALKNYEFRFVRKDGEVRNIHLAIDVIPGTTKSIASLLDFTDRKRMEEALRESEEKFREIFNNANDAIEIQESRDDGSPGRNIEVNEVACRMLGYTREELLALSPLDYATGYYNRPMKQIFRELKNNRHAIFETEHRRKDGTVVPVEVNAHVVLLQGRKVALSVIRDITERKRAEEKIAHLASFPELNPNPVLEIAPSGEILYANPAVGATLAKNGLGDDPCIFLPADLGTLLPTLMEGDIQREIRIGDRVFLETIALASRMGTIRIYTRDITDRKRMEEDLRESQAKLAEAMDIANLVNWEFDVPTGIFIFDDRFYKLYGTTAEREGGTRMSAEKYAREFCHPDDVHMVADEVKKAIETTDPGFTSTIEHRIIRRDGDVRHIVVRYSITKDAAGRTIRTQGANQDITDRKKAESALRQSEENFARAFNSNPAALAITRIGDGKFLSVNEAYSRIMEYDPGEIISRNVTDLDIYVNPGERDRLVETLRKEGSVRHFELPVRNRSGGTRNILVSMEKVLYDNEECILSTFIDITERKQIEEALRESEEKYRNLVELASAGIAIVQDGVIRYSNRSLAEIWGGPVEDLVQLPMRDVIHPDEREKVIERYRRRLAGEQLPSIYETVLLRRDGSSYPAELHARLISYEGRPADLILIQDVTDRKRAEKALRESQERYRQIVEGTNAGVWVLDNEFSTIYANEQMAVMLGTTPAEMIGQPISAYLQAESQGQLDKTLTRIGSGAIPDAEFPFTRKDGTSAWLRLTAGPIYGAGGQRVGFTGIFSDITESRLAEVAVKEAREKYQDIVEFAVEGIYQIDTKGRLLTANSSMARILGYASVEDLLASVTDTARQLWAIQEQRVEYLRHLKDTGTIEGFEAEFFRKNGEGIWVSLNTRAVKGPDGSIVYSEGTLEDITQRKLAEQALRESEEMYRNPVEQSPVGVFLVQDGMLLYANPKLAEMTGFPLQDIIRKPFAPLIHPDDLPRLMERLGRLLHGEVASDEIEYRSIRKDGSIIQVQAYGSLMAFRGRPAIYGTIIDVTDRKRMADQISDSLKEKEVLLREIHHRVKNNMQVISSLLSVQSQNIRDENVRGLFRESQNRIRSIALVHELLYRSDNLDQIEYGAYLKKMFIPLFESYSVDQRKVTIAIEAPKVMITIDKAVPCSLIVNELISNSLKHAFPGDRRGSIRITFGLDAQKGEYALDYADDGVGLPAGLDIRTLNSLGMKLINGLTRQLGGTLEHVAGHGAHFRITFPAGSPEGGQR
ncbi:MAG TPA: PAS domain S-box protein [Methanomicrobiales archaeon]|nr:PAS domain S-box protein [Methanomicrobiales archaeon]